MTHPTDERAAMIEGIAQIIDHPSVYMGGPSRNSLRIAEAIVKEYGDGWTRGGAEAGLRDLLAECSSEQHCRCIHISRETDRAYENGQCVHQRARAALARPSAPETLAWAVVGEDGGVVWCDVDAGQQVAEMVADGEGGKTVRVAIQVVEDEA